MVCIGCISSYSGPITKIIEHTNYPYKGGIVQYQRNSSIERSEALRLAQSYCDGEIRIRKEGYGRTETEEYYSINVLDVVAEQQNRKNGRENKGSGPKVATLNYNNIEFECM